MTRSLQTLSLLMAVACAGTADRDDTSEYAASVIEDQPLSLDPLQRPGGTSLSTTIDGLTESVSPFGGALSLSLPIGRLGEETLEVHYASNEETSFAASGSETQPRSAGLGPYWQPSWLGRFRTGDGIADGNAHWHRGPLFEYADGRRARWLRGGAIDRLDTGLPPQFIVHGGETMLEDFSRVRVWCRDGDSAGQTTACLADDGVPLRYEVVDDDGTTYRANHFVGSSWYGAMEGNDEGWFHVTEREDVHGNFVRVRYYGQSDDSARASLAQLTTQRANNTPVPRVIEMGRRTRTGTQVLRRAFVHLEGHADELGRVPHDVLGRPSLRTRIEALVWAGPNGGGIGASTVQGGETLAADGWVTTRFDYGCYDDIPECRRYTGPEHEMLRGVRMFADSLGGADADADASLDFGFRYDFDPFDDQLLDDKFRPRVTAVELPHGAELQYGWAKHRIVQTGVLQASRLESERLVHRSVASRTLVFHDGATDRSLAWVLHHDNVAHPSEGDPARRGDVSLRDADRPLVRATVRLLASAGCGSGGDCGSTSVYHFAPPTWSASPAAALTGKLVRSEHFDADLGGVPGDRDRATHVEEYGYFIAAVGRSQTPTAGGHSGGVKRANLVFRGLPAFSLEETHAANGEVTRVVSVSRDVNRNGLFSLVPSSHPASTARDYDQYGNARVLERYVVDGAVQIERSSWDCGFVSYAYAPLEREWVTVDNVNRNWSCRQDSLTAEPTDDLALYQRTDTAWAVHNAPHASALAAANLLRLPHRVVKKDVNGNAISDVTQHYDHREARHPLCDGACDTRVAGLATATEVRDPSGLADTRWTYRRFFGPDAANDWPGTLAAETTPLGDGTYLGQRFERRSPMTRAPSREMQVTTDGNVIETARIAYDGWGQPQDRTDEIGVTEHIARDVRGRERGRSYTPPSGATVQVSRTLYRDEGVRYMLTETFDSTEDGEPNRDVQFLDDLGRAFQTQREVAPTAGDRRVVGTRRTYWRDTTQELAVHAPAAGSAGWATPVAASTALRRTVRDGFGRILAVREEGNGTARSTRYEYGDVQAELEPMSVRVTDPEGVVVERRYDGFGRQIATLEGADSVTTHRYDARGVLTHTTHPDGAQTVRGLNGFGELRTLRRPEWTADAVVRRDGAGRVELEIRPDGERLRTEYDERGRVERVVDARRTTALASYRYDDYRDADWSGWVPTAAGRLTEASTEAGRFTYGYDARGEILVERSDLSELAPKQTRYVRDGHGTPTEVHYQEGAADGFSLRSTYAPGGLVRRIERVDGTVRTLSERTFDGKGRLAKDRRLPSGSGQLEAIDYAYGVFGDLEAINDPAALGTDHFAMRIHRRGGVAGVVTGRDDDRTAGVEWASPGQPRAMYAFEYDDRGQLTESRLYQRGRFWLFAGAVERHYDSVGNIELTTRTQGRSVDREYYCYQGRRLMGTSAGPCSSDIPESFRYDAAGATTHHGLWADSNSIFYRPDGLTRTVTQGRRRVRYEYDAKGAVAIEEVSEYTDEPCWQVSRPDLEHERGPVHVGSRRVGSLPRGLDRGCWRQRSRTHTVRDASGAVLAQYVTEAETTSLSRQNLAGIAEARPAPGFARLALHTAIDDAMGTPRVEVREDGVVTRILDTDPWGALLASRSSDPAVGPRTDFTGHVRETALADDFLHTGARLYDPVLGRFLSVDPLASLEPGHTGYAYARNSPTVFVDPTGLSNELCCNEAGGPGDRMFRMALQAGTTVGVGQASLTGSGAYDFDAQQWVWALEGDASLTLDVGANAWIRGEISYSIDTDSSGRPNGYAIPVVVPIRIGVQKASLDGNFYFNDAGKLTGFLGGIGLEAGGTLTDFIGEGVTLQATLGKADVFGGPVTPGQKQAILSFVKSSEKVFANALRVYQAKTRVAHTTEKGWYEQARDGLSDFMSEARGHVEGAIWRRANGFY